MTAVLKETAVVIAVLTALELALEIVNSWACIPTYAV
jgi:hypothetical protein